MPKEIDYSRWRKIISRIQIGIVVAIFFVELINNLWLTFSKASGYVGNELLGSLLKFFIIPSSINFLILALSQIIVKKNLESFKIQKYMLILSTTLIVGNVSIAHYHYADVFMTFAMAIVLSVFYEDKRLCSVTFVLSIVLLSVACIFRGMDPERNVDIVPESAVAFSALTTFFVIILNAIDHLQESRRLMNEYMLYEEKAKHAKELEIKNHELKLLSEEIVEAFSKTLDYNDPYTAGHSRRVGEYSKMIARRMNLPKETCEKIYFVGLLHDVGKIGIDNDIINKNSRLTDDEFNEIKKHPYMGYEILKCISAEPDYRIGAKFHHERVDGNGYPDGSKDIPLIGRIIAVADAYDAMTSKRSYRDGLPQDVVKAELIKNANTQFDQSVVDVMVSMIDEDKDFNLRQK